MCCVASEEKQTFTLEGRGLVGWHSCSSLKLSRIKNENAGDEDFRDDAAADKDWYASH